VIRAKISRSLGEDFAGPQNFEDFPTVSERRDSSEDSAIARRGCRVATLDARERENERFSYFFYRNHS